MRKIKKYTRNQATDFERELTVDHIIKMKNKVEAYDYRLQISEKTSTALLPYLHKWWRGWNSFELKEPTVSDKYMRRYFKINDEIPDEHCDWSLAQSEQCQHSVEPKGETA